MKVLLVADFYPPAPGGLEAHVRRLAHALRRAGDEVAVVAGGGPSAPEDDGGVPVHRLAVGLDRLPGAYRTPGRSFHPPWADARFVAGIAAVARRFAPDVVHAHGWCEFSAAVACGDRWPLVVTLHDYGLRCPKKTLLRGGHECGRGRGLRCATCPGPEQGAVKRCLLAGALARTVRRSPARGAHFLAVSRHVAARHREDPALRLARIDVVPNFLDLPAGPPAEPDGTGVLFVGPALRHKGLPVLLRAWPDVRPHHARLTVVGVDAGTVAPPGGRAVEFAGRLDADGVWRRLREAALVVAPAIWPEPCPTAVLEALAAGRPVVASDTGGHRDLVTTFRTGLLVPPGDPRALAAAVTELLADPARLRTMARAARDSAEQFGTAAVVGRIRAVYAGVSAGRGVR